MSAARLTVVVANYNHGHFLPRCLDAILAQERPADEVLVIDDASTDDSVAVIERYCVRHPAIRLIRHAVNQGVFAVMNEGLREARGDCLLYAAADDWILPGLFARALDALERHPQAGLCSALTLQLTAEGGRTRPLPTPVVLDRPGYIPPRQALALLMKEDSWILGNTAVLRTDAVLDAGGYRGELASFCDGFLYQQVALKHGVCFIPEALAVWRLLGAGYSAATVVNAERAAGISEHATRLMAGEFGGLFPPEYVRRWQGRWTCVAVNGALRSAGLDDAVLARLWPDHTALDRALLIAAAGGGAAGRTAGAAYLTARLRGGDIPRLVLRRLRWLLGAYPPR